jgi:Zn ribbon nucleic-acid-binding protein
MNNRHSVRTPVKACPHCTMLDIAHVGDTDTSRWLECRECGHVWNHSLPAPAASVRDHSPSRPEPRRWTVRDEVERRIDEHRSRPHEPAWANDPGCPRDRWPTERDWSERTGRK